MRNKTHLLTIIGVMIFVIGLSSLAGTIYRSTDTSGFSYGAMFGIKNVDWCDKNAMTYAMPPRDLTIELKTNGTIDFYLIDSEGITLWRSEGTLKPVWSVKNVSSQTFTLQLTHRDAYGILVYNPNNSTTTFNVVGELFGVERDLLSFSLLATATGSITILSAIMLQKRKQKPAAPFKIENKNLTPKTIPDPQTNIEQHAVKLNHTKPTKQFQELITWELEEYLAFPTIEILIVIAICTVLSSSIVETSPALSYSNLLSSARTIFMFLIFVAGALFCHSYAGSIAKGETKMMLSYPVQRRYLFLSKFTSLFTILFIIYASVFAMQIYLLVLNPLEPLFYASLLFLALQIMLVSAITTALSLITKNEMLSILVSILLLFGLENIASPTSVVSFTGRFTTGFAYISQQVHGVLPTGTGLTTVPTITDTSISILVSVGVSAFLIILSYIYYARKMEID